MEKSVGAVAMAHRLNRKRGLRCDKARPPLGSSLMALGISGKAGWIVYLKPTEPGPEMLRLFLRVRCQNVREKRESNQEWDYSSVRHPFCLIVNLDGPSSGVLAIPDQTVNSKTGEFNPGVARAADNTQRLHSHLICLGPLSIAPWAASKFECFHPCLR